VIVAGLAWLLVVRSFPGEQTGIVFHDRPLADVYHETVEFGFEPYYVCDEDDRFRDTFYYRHGQALRLVETPPGRRMVGLSYLHGISRHTTAMLARVDGEPVIVFVDQLDRDRPMKAPDPATGLHQFRRELGNLVMYEVTPRKQPVMMDYLELSEPTPSATRNE